MKEFNSSRRLFMKLGLGAIGLGGFTYYGIKIFNFEYFIKSTLRKMLGNYNIPDTQMTKFCHDFVNIFGEKKMNRIIMRKQISILEPIAERLFGVKAYWAVEMFERKLLTEFILSTNYLKVGNPAEDLIEYHGLNIPCNNPFAKLGNEKL